MQMRLGLALTALGCLWLGVAWAEGRPACSLAGLRICDAPPLPPAPPERPIRPGAETTKKKTPPTVTPIWPELVLLGPGTILIPTLGSTAKLIPGEQPTEERLEEFQIAKSPVTAVAFRRFCRATSRSCGNLDGHREHDTVTSVTWSEARMYVEWLNKMSQDIKYKIPDYPHLSYAFHNKYSNGTKEWVGIPYDNDGVRRVIAIGPQDGVSAPTDVWNPEFRDQRISFRVMRSGTGEKQ